MARIVYRPPVINYDKVRKSKTIPDQSMSIQEIVKRFVRGIPVDVLKREPVYSDQQDHDLEKLSRMDFGEKAEYAQALKRQGEELQNELRELAASAREAREKEASAQAQAQAQTTPAQPGA